MEKIRNDIGLNQGCPACGPSKVLMRPTAYSKFSWSKEVY